MAEMITKKDLLKSQAFETALTEGAEYKKSIITTYKKQNKDNYQRFQENMYEANVEVKKILDTKKKKRTEADNEVLKKFKSDVSTLYRQTTDFLIPEKLEDGKKSKVEKIVEKIMPVISMLRYIDENILDKELAKHGLQITAAKLEDICPGLATDDKKKVIKDIFNEAKNIKMKVAADNEQISDMIFNSKVPIDLQYDKNTNNTGLKPGDFSKLVDVKTKLLLAQTEDAKAKIDEKIEHIATEKTFEAARAELVRDSLTTMQ